MSETGEKNKFAASIRGVAKKIGEKATSVSEGVEDYFNRKKLEKLMPMPESDLSPEVFRHERLIRVVNYDSKRDGELFAGSVGFYEKTPDRRIPTIYTKNVEKLGLTFFPHLSESVFLADPRIEGRYIEIDEYYNYMKQVRVNELTLIAQSLGAKHVKIRLQTKSRKSISSKISGALGFSKAAVNVESSGSSNSSESFEVWADTEFKTGFRKATPVLPEVIYFSNESDIQALIQMVMVNKSKLTKRTYKMKSSSSSGMSMTEAASISGAIKCINVKAGGTFEKSAEEESEATLEYTIEF